MQKKFSKILSVVLSALLLISIVPISASAATYGELTYTVSDGEVTITGCNVSAREVAIPETINGCPVTSIGDYAFMSCEDIVSVTIPDSVTSIGNSAFECCINLAEISLPDGLVSIGSDAFYYCKSLSKITIPDSVKSLGGGAFGHCLNLSDVSIPNTLTYVEERLFYNCTTLANITIPDDVAGIGDLAFYGCTSLTNIIIPEIVTHISDSAFSACSGLTSLTISVFMTKISYAAFAECYSLKDVYYLGTEAQWNEINIEAENECLTNAIMHFNDVPGHIHMYYGAETLPSCTAQGYTIWTCECGDTFVDDYTDKLPHKDNDNNGYCDACGNVIATKEEYFTYEITDNEVTITGYTGTDTEVIIPDVIKGYPVISIGSEAFSYSRTIERITLPYGIKTIGDYAFANCVRLASINIPNSVTSIGDWAFAVTNIETISIPASVVSIGKDVLWGTCDSLAAIRVDENNLNYSSDTAGVLFDKDKTKLILYPCGNSRIAYTLPESVKEIENGAFSSCGCAAIESVTLPLGLETIGSQAFSGCPNLTSINLPETVTTIGFEAFAFCHSLTNIIIPDSVTCIEMSTFGDCTGLTEVKIPVSVTVIELNAFGGCNNLKNVYYGGSEKQWNDISMGFSNEPLLNANIHFTITDHEYSSEITTPATHLTEGVITYTCACGDIYTEAIAKTTEHTYEAVMTDPTCTAQGFTTYACECGDSYVSDYVDVIDHTDANGDYMCDYGCGYEFENSDEAEKPEELTFFERIKAFFDKIFEWFRNLFS